MTDDPSRPDPDQLLRLMKAEAEQGTRAKLRIFFGFAPGVGKTYRMLQVARDLVDQKVDVVIGVIETHGRYDTGALVLGLELLPRRKVDHRGRTLDEFDLEAALARKPKVLLVDELAHTNAPGLRHSKRWQDVFDLLDAGIDVYTTVNVQHIESLNDVVAQITHVQVRETIPDLVLDRADAIELVDIAPEELLQRLREGKVYLPEQAARATQHFFQRGNLLALRELALRRTAERVDVDVRAYREQHGVEKSWGTAERILVCVGPAPASARLVRATRRMAAGLRAPWVASWVDAPARGPLSATDRDRLESHLRLVQSLGGEVVRLSGASVSGAILDYARRHHVTRILLGKPTHGRWSDLLRGSLLDDVVRGSGEIDVHVISGDEEDDAPRPSEPARAAPWRPGSYAIAVGIVAAATAVSTAARQIFGVPDVEMLYLLGVMLAAVFAGRGPSVLAAALSVAAYDFFFVPPYGTFAIADARYGLTFAMMFGVGLVLGTLTHRLRMQEGAARDREERTADLYAFSRELVSSQDAAGLAAVTARHAAKIFAADASLLVDEGTPGLLETATSTGTPLLVGSDLGVARWVHEHGRLAGLGTDTLPGAKAVCAPLRIGARSLGVLALMPRSGAGLTTDQREFLEAFARQGAFALERARLETEARAAALKVRTEELRNTLLSSVSHDLRTPLATITGTATTLRDEALLPPETRLELLDSLCDEAERLERLVGNLLDMTRLDAGGVSPKRDWVPLVEVVGTALARLEKRLAPHPVHIALADDLPLVSADPILLGQLFVNLLENAARHTPAGTPIDVLAKRDAAGIVVEVADRGPGLPAGEEERVFERFHRAAAPGVQGAGLGLPICRGIARAHGGSLVGENRPGGGAVFRLTLPQPQPPPGVPAEGTI